MVLFESKKDCCGCGICSEVCEFNAIEMLPDDEGFLYPVINQDICVNCGKCKKNCSFQDTNRRKMAYPIQCFALKHNEEIRAKSQSGGAFTAFSDYALENKGTVYGVVLDEEFKAIHVQAKDEVVRNKQRGSKYIQSVFYPVVKQIKEDMNEKRPIVVTGTSCQIAAIRNYLEGYEQDNIYFIDILCHGVPSPMIWKDFLNWSERKENKKISRVVFRDKTFAGWHGHIDLMEFGEKKINSTIFRNMFYDHYILRPSCYNCPYTRIDRASDITIGDCWGVEKNVPEFDDNKGVSLVLVNTLKGKKLMENVKDGLELRSIDLQQYLQRPLRVAASIPSNRTEFWNDYMSHDFDFIVKKYASDNARKRNKRKGRLEKLVQKVFMR